MYMVVFNYLNILNIFVAVCAVQIIIAATGLSTSKGIYNVLDLYCLKVTEIFRPGCTVNNQA